MKYIIVVGNIVDGFTFQGPFDFYEDAEEYASQKIKNDWVIAQIFKGE